MCGGVGSGKTRVALVYYYTKICGGTLKINGAGKTTVPKRKVPLYVITTGKTRDSGSWSHEALNFYDVHPVVDSWNNIKKYADVKNAFFVFDEQRVVGNGEWSKTFRQIAKSNDWIILSATPGDTWIEYAQIFIANGFYKNITDFKQQHVVYNQFVKYPKIEGYRNIYKLERLRSEIMVIMNDRRITIPHHINYKVSYDKAATDNVYEYRRNPYTSLPIKTASEFCLVLRKLANSDKSRLDAMVEILRKHKKAIVFYNFDFELYAIKDRLLEEGIEYSEWNGHFHKEIPSTDSWAYLVQYAAGAEGWNCIETDTTIFFSANYSYKIMEQAAGRINRMNTPFIDLYFYHLVSDAQIDKSIAKAIARKKKFNEIAYYRKFA